MDAERELLVYSRQEFFPDHGEVLSVDIYHSVHSMVTCGHHPLFLLKKGLNDLGQAGFLKTYPPSILDRGMTENEMGVKAGL